MARKNPLTKITDLAVDALKNPRETAEKAVDQVKETTAVARSMAARAATRASDTASAVAHHTRASRHRGANDSAPAAEQARPTPEPAKAQRADESRKLAGDPVKPPATKKATKKAATGKKAPAEKAAPAKKAAGKKAAPGKKAAAKKPAATRAPAHHEPTPADIAKNIPPHPPKTQAQATPGDKLPPRRPAQS